jgi:hypothetical protein
MRPSSLRPAALPLWGLVTLLSSGCFVGTEGGGGPTTPTRNACESNNPCTQGDKTVCVDDNGVASCLCKAGTLPRPNGTCEPITTANCPEHAGDAAEPDDCIAQAPVLGVGNAPSGHTIEPLGDSDFFRVEGTARNVYFVSVEPVTGALLPRVDVFDQQGQWLTAQDGQPRVSLGFKARSTAPYYVRVTHSPRDPSAATGGYTLNLARPVVDEEGDSPNDAIPLKPSPGGGTSPTLYTGRFEYGEDVDAFAFPVLGNVLYRIEFDTGSNRVVPVLAAYVREDVKTPFLTANNTFVELRGPSATTVYLAFTAARGVTGSYAFRVLEYR